MSYKDKAKEKEAKRKSYLKNKEEVYRRYRDRRKRNKEHTDSVKSTKKCLRCGFSNPSALDFHHKNPRNKTNSLCELVRSCTTIEKLNKEIEKCDVLCANCHAKEHRPSSILLDAKWLDSYRTKKREWFVAFCRTVKCKRCNESDYRCLEFHHRNPEEKSFTIAYMLTSGHSISRLIEELDKCDTLCCNCHRKLHRE